MLAPRADPMNAFLKDELLNTARDLLDDTNIRTSITLKGLTSVSHDLEAGTYTPTVQADTLNAIRRNVGTDEVANGGGLIEMGDFVYLVDQTAVTGALQSVDTIVDGTDVLEVIRWEQDPLGHFYHITARLV